MQIVHRNLILMHFSKAQEKPYNNVVLMYQWWTSIKICSIPILKRFVNLIIIDTNMYRAPQVFLHKQMKYLIYNDTVQC